ncbi:MAG: hypothetical protein H8E27_02825 [Verrucomicrobia subdivision 3 bacterium]|nr:hypothetical protein [Limisphaerales bacterium]
MITIFLCGWMVISPMQIGADGAGGGSPQLGFPKRPNLDLVPAMGSTHGPELSSTDRATPQPHRLREFTNAEWAKHRRQTTRQRANAIEHVKRARWIPNITYAQIQEIYDAKKIALAKVVAHGSFSRTLIAQAKTRALAEVKAMVAVLRDRQQAEQLALMEAEASMREANPNYDEDALRKAMAEAQQHGGIRVKELEGLPVLPNATAMNYPKGGPNVIAKRTPEPTDTPQEIAQLKALRDFKKQLALESVMQEQQSRELKQQTLSHREMETKLSALLDQYVDGNIDAQSYYEQREQLLKAGGQK